MATIASMTGMSQPSGPLYINYQPFSWDFSAIRQSQDTRAKLALDLAERNEKARKKAQELEIPEMKGHSNDRAADYQAAINAKSAYDAILSHPGAVNAIVAAQSPEAREALNTYIEVTNPTRNIAREQRYESTQKAVKRVNEDPDVANLPFTYPDGAIMADPENPARPMKTGDVLYRLDQDPRWSLDGYGGQVNAELSSARTISQLNTKIDGFFRGLGKNSWGDTKAGPAGGPGPFREYASEVEGMLTQLQMGVKGSSNLGNINRGLSALTSQIDDIDLNALFPAFENTQQYQDGLESGKYLTNGVFDARKVYYDMRNAPVSKLEGVPVKGGKPESIPLSFVDKFLIDRAMVQLQTHNEETVSVTMQNLPNGDGPGKQGRMEPRLFAHARLPQPTEVIGPNGEAKTQFEIPPNNKTDWVQAAAGTVKKEVKGGGGSVGTQETPAILQTIGDAMYIGDPKSAEELNTAYQLGEGVAKKVEESFATKVFKDVSGRMLSPQDLEGFNIVGFGPNFVYAANGTSQPGLDDINNWQPNASGGADLGLWRMKPTEAGMVPELDMDMVGSLQNGSPYTEIWAEVTLATDDERRVQSLPTYMTKEDKDRWDSGKTMGEWRSLIRSVEGLPPPPSEKHNAELLETTIGEKRKKVPGYTGYTVNNGALEGKYQVKHYVRLSPQDIGMTEKVDPQDQRGYWVGHPRERTVPSEQSARNRVRR